MSPEVGGRSRPLPRSAANLIIKLPLGLTALGSTPHAMLRTLKIQGSVVLKKTSGRKTDWLRTQFASLTEPAVLQPESFDTRR